MISKSFTWSNTAFAKTCCAILLVGFSMSCDSGQKRTLEERIEAELVEKLSGWQNRRALNCRTKAMEIAVERADSMVLEYAREQKIKLERPSRPIRPDEPPLLRPNDTLNLEPFLSDSL